MFPMGGYKQRWLVYRRAEGYNEGNVVIRLGKLGDR